MQIKNSNRTKLVLNRKISDYKRILMLLGSRDVSGLRRLISASLKNGASPDKICETILSSLQGAYSPRGGFNDRDLDIAFLVKSIGGPRLLFALQKSHGLPSVSTVRRYQRIPRMRPSIGRPKAEDIVANISSFFAADLRPPPTWPCKIPTGKLPGNVLMFDGIALEPKCRYDQRSDHIIGLCREHADHYATNLDSMAVIDKIKEGLMKDKSDPSRCCYGVDATVVAIAPYARSDFYSPTPLVLSPSDKTEKGRDLAIWIQTTLDAWKTHPLGEKVHGPIWALASDGDACFRVARYHITIYV